jgi:curved DNA-binding protein CbpA
VATIQPNAVARTPHLVPGVDQRSLPIGPEEAFVLSRVDGKTTQADICSATGLDSTVVGKVLDRLIDLGAVQLREDGETTDSPAQPSPHQTTSSPATKIDRPVLESKLDRRFNDVESAALYDPAELDEDCDLDLTRRRAILDFYYRLDQLDHYALLELDPTAEKKDVKAAYFKYVSVFHPDKYYGKSVGSFRPKLEQVFSRLTEAHDTLTRKKTRQAYDEYLASRRRNRALERALYGDRDHHDELDRAHQRIHDAARPNRVGGRRDPRVDDDEPGGTRHERLSWPRVGPAEEQAVVQAGDPRSESFDANSTGAPAQEGTPVPTTGSSPDPGHEDNGQEDGSDRQSNPPRPSSPPPDPDARRRAFARRMGGGAPSVPPPGAATAPPRRPSEVKRQVADDLKRMYSNRVRGARDNQVSSYVEAAEAALAEDNPVAAANALRVAAALSPDDELVTKRLAEVERQANAKLASNYLEQAQYEEKEQHWEQAATSYQRAALGNPTARMHERVAFCLLKAGGDMKLASEHGKRAVNLAPNQASMRVTLAEVYLKAGMRQSAVAEFERAQALAPHDDTIKDWLKRIRRNQV